jgi:hypothetical protein
MQVCLSSACPDDMTREDTWKTETRITKLINSMSTHVVMLITEAEKASSLN